MLSAGFLLLEYHQWDQATLPKETYPLGERAVGLSSIEVKRQTESKTNLSPHRTLVNIKVSHRHEPRQFLQKLRDAASLLLAASRLLRKDFKDNIVEQRNEGEESLF